MSTQIELYYSGKSVETSANPSKLYQLRRISTDIAILNILKKVAKMLATFLVF